MLAEVLNFQNNALGNFPARWEQCHVASQLLFNSGTVIPYLFYPCSASFSCHNCLSLGLQIISLSSSIP